MLPARASREAPDAEEQLGDLRRDLADELSELRVVAPNAEDYAGDVAELLAGEGYDLVCVLGADSARIVLELADAFPATSLCAMPADDQEDLPSNVRLIDLRQEEVAYVAGVAAAAAAPRSPPVLVTRAEGAEPDQLRQALVNGYRSGDGQGRISVLELGADPSAGDIEDVAARLARAEARTVLFDTGGADVALRDALAPRLARLLVVGDAELLVDPPEGPAILGVRRQLAVLLEPVITGLLDTFESGVASRGFADEALALATGDNQPSRRVRRAVVAAVEGIVAGDVDVVEAPAPSPSPTTPTSPTPSPTPAQVGG